MSYEDPFASAPAEPEATKNVTPQTAAEAPKPTVVQQEDGKVVLTFKGGRDFDAPWIVIHATSLEDAYEQLTTKGKLLGDVMSRTQNAATHFAGSAPAQPNSAAPARASRAPQAATEPPPWAPPKPYDDFVYRSGVTKSGRNAGKTWHAWMPPQKDDPQGRDAEFFNAP